MTILLETYLRVFHTVIQNLRFMPHRKHNVIVHYDDQSVNSPYRNNQR
jgi:hypothetical protein